MARVANDFESTLLGEAGGRTAAQRYNDMVNIASVAVNRAIATGTPISDIISAPGQFSAFGRALPSGVEKFRDLARMAIEQVTKFGPVNKATFYATPEAVQNLPNGLKAVTKTAAHQYFDDPKGRAIRTASGYVKPSQDDISLAAYGPTPTRAPRSSAAQALEAMAAPTAAPQMSAQEMSFSNPLGAQGARVTSNFGSRASPMGIGSTNHAGVDITAAMGRGQTGYAVETAGTGVVTKAGPARGYGNLVEVTHPNGYTSRYGHLGSINVSVGDTIARGTPVGTVGNTGTSTAPHLHFEMRDELGVPVDPASVVGFNAQASVPSPTANPTRSAAFTPSRTDLAPARSVQSVSVPGTINDQPTAASSFGTRGVPGALAGVPAQSVQTSTISPSREMVDASRRAVEMTAAPGMVSSFAPTDDAQVSSAGTLAGVPASSVKSMSITPDNVDTAFAPAAPSAAAALSDLAEAKPENTISEVAGYTAYSPEVQNQMNQYSYAGLTRLDAPIDPVPAAMPAAPVTAPITAPVTAPVEIAAYTPPAQVAPATAAMPAAPSMPDIPSGAQAAYGFHSGLNNAAMASNGNMLSRDAIGNTYNYSPEFDVTTISDPAGNTVGVREGKVTAETAAASDTAGQGLFGGLDGVFGGIGSALGSAFSSDDLSNGIVGGLGSLGGGMIGSALGPVGGLLGSALGRHLAVQNNPFARNITPQEALLSGNFTRGLGFAAAPSGGIRGLSDAERSRGGGLEGFGSGKNASEAEANRGGGGASSGGKGLW